MVRAPDNFIVDGVISLYSLQRLLLTIFLRVMSSLVVYQIIIYKRPTSDNAASTNTFTQDITHIILTFFPIRIYFYIYYFI